MNVNLQPDFNSSHRLRSRGRIALAWFGAGIVLITAVTFFHLAQSLASREITIENGNQPSLWKKIASILPLSGDKPPEDKDYVLPPAEKDRQDILILGIRGKDDPEDGGMLTDTIMLLSFNKTTKKSSLVSIPRDFYVKITNNLSDKINTAYVRLGLSGTKKLFSRITGVYVDDIVVFDFSSFEKIVTELGGIDITLDKPFEETSQWGYEFSLPAGPNHLDGQSALYYVRSRYSTSDFDRAARQQKVIFALKQKALGSDFLSDPIKALSLLTTVRSNIQTDINVLDIKKLLSLAHEVSDSSDNLKRYVITTDNLLYEGRLGNGAYVLLPKGDSLEPLKNLFREFLK